MTCPSCQDVGYTDETNYGVEYSLYCKERCPASERKQQVDTFAYHIWCMIMGHGKPW